MHWEKQSSNFRKARYNLNLSFLKVFPCFVMVSLFFVDLNMKPMEILFVSHVALKTSFGRPNKHTNLQETFCDPGCYYLGINFLFSLFFLRSWVYNCGTSLPITPGKKGIMVVK